jgi:hypothetical protein
MESLVALAASALAAALALPGAHVELAGLDPRLPAGCAVERATAPRPVVASGRAALRLEGRDARGAACEGWAWADARVLAPALVLVHDVADGERLEGAFTVREREVRAGRVPVAALPPGVTAARALRAGTALEAPDLRAGPRPGEPIAVLVRLGGLSVEQPGRALPCARAASAATSRQAPKACALLPSGRRVEGVLDAGRLVVESP